LYVVLIVCVLLY